MSDTLKTPPVFCSVRPDWSKQVLVDRTALTAVFMSANATEQRQRKRVQSKIGISYQVLGMTPAESFAREIQNLLELGSPVVVPVWPYSLPISAQAGQVLDTGPLAGYPIRLPGWVFIVDDNGEAFYPVGALDPAGIITISGPAVPQFSNGVIYACIQGTRREGAASFMASNTENEETIAVDES